MMHGYAEHSARYQHVVDVWKTRGFAVARFDLRGHGRSEGPRGHVDSFSDYVEDVQAVFDALRAEASWQGGAKPILFGHSMGGLVATHAALVLGTEIGGLALTSPFFAVPEPIPPVQLAIGKALSRVVPRLRQPSGLKRSNCTHDSARWYEDDPLAFDKVTIGWFVHTAAAQEDALARVGTLKARLFGIAAGDDKIVSLDATRRFFSLAGSAEKELEVREGLYHEVLNEPDWRDHAERLAARMTSWATA
jgi:alpha-beta hydrolase superfamily lysophospholipase